jgi:hypothetical protein
MTLQEKPHIPELLMKFVPVCLLALSFGASAQSYVQPYHRSNGTLVGGHYRSAASVSTYSGTGSSANSTYVQSHVTQSGTYVQGYHRTAPDSSTLNNYGTSGNFNPYSGAIGSRSGCAGYGC